MILLLDTDVLLDVVLDRRPHSDAASRLLDNLQRRPGTGFMAWQVAAAAACQADGIVTRNLRDYAKASIRALGPEAANDELETR